MSAREPPSFARLQAALDRLSEQMKANHAAILRAIRDTFGGGPPTAAA